MIRQDTVKVNGKDVLIKGERNLLELIRKTNIDVPTFCYHSELSVYGACRLCLVEVEGRGIVASCSVLPEAGMVIKTHTEEIREMRRINIELLLANHEQNCPTCPKSTTCQLQMLAKRLGVDEVRFKATHKPKKIDKSSPALLRNSNKCILCGDCVRACAEIQAIGAIDFAHRGAEVAVCPAFDKELNAVECVHCGQCAAVCPTGALTPRSEVDGVWKVLHDPEKIVVVQIAPAVRVAVGEQFGLESGQAATGQITAALKAMGFSRVFDTSFAADLTVLEEANEFLQRKAKGENIPQFTSCCPAWVKFAEQYYPTLLSNLSSCRSPQQMFGSLAKDRLPLQMGIKRENLVVVSIMPCTAKKFEAGRPEFGIDGQRDVDFVLTTQELSQMIAETGLQFKNLQPESMDLPMGFKTGAGIIFGASGGVTEAVLRYAAEKITGIHLDNMEFEEVRGEKGLREAVVVLGNTTLKLAVVHGLRNARTLADAILAGAKHYDLVEVMACPGGCIGGAGQPVSDAPGMARKQRAEGLFNLDRMLQLHKSQENHLVAECYERHLGEIGGPKAHKLLHTKYQNRRRIDDAGISLMEGGNDRLVVSVCVGTSCFLKGSQELLRRIIAYVEQHKLAHLVNVQATFCLERCGTAPNVMVGETLVENACFDQLLVVLNEQLKMQAAPRG